MVLCVGINIFTALLRKFAVPKLTTITNFMNLCIKYVFKLIAISSCFAMMCFLFVACNGKSTTTGSLIYAEKLMRKNPDSALAVLKKIDKERIVSVDDKALYALILTQAEDKCYINSATRRDTLIYSITQLYKRSKNDYHQMLSYYYMARIKYNTNNYSQSILNLLDAENIAKKRNDNFYLGLIYRSFANLYSKIHNNVEYLNYAKASYESFSKTGNQYYMEWALLDVAKAYYKSNNFATSLQMSKELTDAASVRDDQFLIVECLRLSGKSFYAVDDYENTLYCFETIRNRDKTRLTADDYYYFGAAYLGLDRIDEAIGCMKESQHRFPNNQRLKYEVNRYLGRYKEAMEALENENSNQNEIINELANQNLTEAVSDYHKYEKSVIVRELQQERKTKIILACALMVIIVLVIFVVKLIIKNQRKKMENNMLQVSNLRDTLEIKESEVKALKDAINKLFEQRFNTIDDLSSSYYEYQGSINEKSRIHKDVMQLVSKLGSDRDTINEIETFVNTYKDNIMVKFKESLPNFKEQDHLLFLYVVAGFSYRAISIFMDLKIENLYNRIYRLRTRITNSSTPHKEVFLREIRT